MAGVIGGGVTVAAMAGVFLGCIPLWFQSIHLFL